MQIIMLRTCGTATPPVPQVRVFQIKKGSLARRSDAIPKQETHKGDQCFVQKMPALSKKCKTQLPFLPLPQQFATRNIAVTTGTFRATAARPCHRGHTVLPWTLKFLATLGGAAVAWPPRRMFYAPSSRRTGIAGCCALAARRPLRRRFESWPNCEGLE